jgi:CubicO group peptidase (beta-lactamase class C family)
MKRISGLTVLLASSLFLTHAHAQADISSQHQVLAQTFKLPDTEAARLLGEWVDLCRTPNPQTLDQWLAANLSAETKKQTPVQAFAHIDLERCTDNGGLRLVSVVQSTPHIITVLVNGVKSNDWFELQFVTNGANRVDQYSLVPATPAESALQKNLSDSAIAQAVNAVVAKEARAGVFSGIVVVARGTQIIASASGGYADPAAETPITVSTQFTLASLGKLFTAASVGQLIDQKKISFDDRVGKFFPDYPNKTVRDKVTVGMLLAHTSGMGDFLDKITPEMKKNGVKRAAEFMPLYDKDELAFAPGTKWSYSNAGLALAGAIVEKVSGEDYPSYIRKHIFAVAGMTDSDPNNVPYVGTNLVTPYTNMTSQGPSQTWRKAEGDIGSPAGGSISTAHDLVRFADALRSGKLESNATFDQMAQPRNTILGNWKYGYAMEIKDIYGRTVVGHQGGCPGVNTNLAMILGSPYTIVVLANKDVPAADAVGDVVIALMVEKAKSGQ